MTMTMLECNAYDAWVYAAPGVALLVEQRGERAQGGGVVAAQPHARHAAHQALQQAGRRGRHAGRVGRRGQQQVVGVRRLRVAQQRVHVGGAEVGRAGRAAVHPPRVPRAARARQRLRAPHSSRAICITSRL